MVVKLNADQKEVLDDVLTAVDKELEEGNSMFMVNSHGVDLLMRATIIVWDEAIYCQQTLMSSTVLITLCRI